MSQLSHFAINADDVGRARKFYEDVFDWTFKSWGPPGFFQIDTGGGARGALQQRRELVPGTPFIGFECTFSVESIDETARRVMASGGKVVLPKTLLGGVGALMFFQDPEGNVFGAMQYER